MIGCSHAWDALEPTGGSGAGGAGSVGSAGGAGPGVSVSTASATSAMSSTGDGSTPSTTTVGSSSMASNSSGVAMMESYVKASLALCANSFAQDTQECEMSAGPGQMMIDTSDAFFGEPTYSYIRFDLDGTLAGKTIDTVAVEIVVASNASSGSDHSGELWQVGMFTQSSISMNLPKKVGANPIGADQGAVVASQVVSWPIPVNLVSANSSLSLGLYPKSDNSTNYWNTSGMAPPQLVIKYH